MVVFCLLLRAMMKKLLSLLLLLPMSLWAASPREALIEQRIKTIGEVYVQEGAGTTSASAPATGTGASGGEHTYQTFCKTCHAMGLAGAPKYGVKADWTKRVAQGKPTLYKHAIQGLNAMPPKGTCMSCSDDDLKAAVDFMLKKIQ